jgi:hypothetical protein
MQAMKLRADLQHDCTNGTRYKALRGQVISLAVVAFANVFSFDTAYAQSNDLGSYQGTIKVSGTEVDPQVSYSASLKISLPVTDRDDESITAEFLSGEAPNATVLISQWDEAHTEKSAGSDGKFASYKCKLAAPKEIPMTPTGVLNVDMEGNTHTLSLTLLGTVDIELNCMHSTSGAYKEKKGIALYIGTGFPGMQDGHPLPFSDAAYLNANYTLVPGAAEENSGPIVQEWDLRLTQ